MRCVETIGRLWYNRITQKMKLTLPNLNGKFERPRIERCKLNANLWNVLRLNGWSWTLSDLSERSDQIK